MRLPNDQVSGAHPAVSRSHRGPGAVDGEKQAFIAETVESYEKYYNRGFIGYRKSVTEAGQFAALEWSGPGLATVRPPGPGVHRLPGRLRHLQRRGEPPQDRQGRHRSDAAHGAQQPGAAGALARCAVPGAGRGYAGRPAELLLHQQRHRRHRRGHQAHPALHQDGTPSSRPSAASTGSPWARSR